MCLSPQQPAEPRPSGRHRHPSRRGVLAGLGAAVGIALLPTPAARAETPRGTRPLLTAMHVHGSWSEGTASWRQQLTRAVESGVDVLWMTDHDHRALASGHLTDLRDCPMVQRVEGTARDVLADNRGGALHLGVVSADDRPASVELAVQELPTARNNLRTGIGGTRLQVILGSCRLDPGATVELVVTMSDHPAYGVVPAGTYALRYRWAAGAEYERSTAGTVGVVQLPLPPAGTTVRLEPDVDAAALWPHLLPFDNGFGMLSAVVTSPGRGRPARAVIAWVRIERTENTEEAVIRRQRELVEAYRKDFPGLTVHPSVEVSDGAEWAPHVNLFGAPQRFVDKPYLTRDEVPEVYGGIITQAHRSGGVVSWNHPLGPDHSSPLPPQAAAADRRAVFASLWEQRLLGADLLEVGYSQRGGHDLDSHLALWDTLSRRFLPLTGTGVSDDHEGRRWLGLANGFLTGIWADSTGSADLADALRAGEAFTSHPTRWPGGAIDVRVGRAPMGSVHIRPAGPQQAAVYLVDLPRRSSVELVTGLVDYAGQDPVTVVRSRPAADLGRSGTGTLTFGVDTSRSCFVRAQVRLADGRLAGTSNPVWLLRETPPDPVPPARVVPS